MESEWWDQHFESSYNRFCTIFNLIILISFFLRLIVSLFSSMENAFGGTELFKFLFISMIPLTLHLLKSTNKALKKLFMYSLLEVLNLALKFYSETCEKDEAILFCLESTLLTLLFQSNIFKSLFVNIIISIKHVCLWFLINKDLKVPNNVICIMVSLVILAVWIIFEKDKRLNLLSAYKAKKIENKTLSELSDLLQMFPQGVIIIDQDFKVQYKNDLTSGIIKQQDLIHFLNSNYTQGSKSSLLTQIKDSHMENASSSLGICTIKNLQYEWSVKSIMWKESLSYMVTIKDVTSMLNYERMKASHKTKIEIIRSISHGLRTPVNGIKLIIEGLLNEVNEVVKEKILQIQTCTSLLEFQINDILDYSDISAGRFKLIHSNFELKSALTSCLDNINIQAKYKNIALKFEFDPSLPKEIFSDKSRIQKLIMNMLSNSIQFTTKGSILLSAYQTPKGIKFSVKDTGIGIPNQNLSEIFKINSNKSLNKGIGLYICKKILKFFNSSFEVSSSLASGTVFSFTLESLNKKSSDPQLISNPSKELTLKKLDFSANRANANETYPKVLVVDDNVFNRLYLTMGLKKKGVLYLEAENGLEAVEIVLKASLAKRWICCVVMDCSMPIMDGWEASRTIRELAENGEIGKMPAIFAHSAYSSEDDVKLSLDAGMIDHITKPTTVEEIIIKISKYIS